MKHSATSAPATTPELIAGRYQVEGTLGQGGMATVYRVLDTTTQRRLAVKRLRSRDKPEGEDEILGLFEHEFYTLAQLAHPRVVEVYDFGKDDAGPYYTMELLDGGDLRELSPLPWKRACALLADVCSVLSLLHSRRLVHRDLSHRNVRCTQDLKAKLIDFGAMVPMGPCKRAVGTPAFVAPEVVALQALDGRADLYSLGATVYYALTGQHAYRARSFTELRNAWRSKPRPPSAFVEDIPKELDQLVLSLIDLDPVARPVNASEVTERLSAIAGLEVEEHLLVSKAYLSTPTLVGRQRHMLQVRRRMLRLHRSRGAAFLIEGAGGVGRTRFLDACVLEAKLAGATVLRADASDAHAGDWGAARVLATRLIDELPREALQAARAHLPVLGHILPELLSAAPQPDGSSVSGPIVALSPTDSIADGGQSPRHAALDGPPMQPGIGADGGRKFRSWRPPPRSSSDGVVLETFDDPQELRPRLQAALLDWFLEVGEQRRLMMAVDDFHRIDEPSAAVIARLCNEMSTRAMLLAATAQTEGPVVADSAMHMLKKSAVHIALKNLVLEDTEQLLGSVFGETSNVKLLADRLQGIAQGNPRAIMQLAQHLVDKGLIRYQAGAWTLPSRIDARDLPGTLTEALKAKTEKLNPSASQLAQTLALSPEDTFGFDECLGLVGEPDKALLLQSINELVTSGVISTDGQYVSLSRQGWVSPLTDDLAEEPRRAYHRKLAEVFSQRGSSDFRVALHLFAAGEEERGLDVLIRDAEASQKDLVQNTEAFYKHIHSLPRNWLEVYKLALELCKSLGRPRKHGFLLRMSVVRFSILTGLEDAALLYDVIEQLVRDSGLQFYRDLGDSLEPDKRLWRALEMAQQQYDATPEAQRVLAPAEAIPELANAMSYAIGIASNAYDFAMGEALPSLEPLEPLSPALGVVDRALKAGRHLLAARYEQAMEEMQKILDRIAQPDRAGLDEMIHRITHYSWAFATGVLDAGYGRKPALKWADEIERDLLHQVNAWRIRVLYYVRQGEAEKAEQCRKRVELMLIQNSPTQHFQNTNLASELMACALADELARVKQLTEDIEKVAALFPKWVPVVHYAKAEYQRIRGDYGRALNEIELALGSITPGRHQVWPHAAATQLWVLYELGRFSEGKRIGDESLEHAQKEEILGLANTLLPPLALIEAKLGDYERAVSHAERAIDLHQTMGTTGVNLGLGYETRARVAIWMGDHVAFGHYVELCAEQYRVGHNPVLTAKYERLLNEAQGLAFSVSEAMARAADFSEHTTGGLSTSIGYALTECSGAADRAQRALAILMKEGRCSTGFLYTIQKDGPSLCAQIGNHAPPRNMDATLTEYVKRQADDCTDESGTVADLAQSAVSELDWANPQGEQYYPLLLGHDVQDGLFVTGVAVLLPDRDREFALPLEACAAVSKALVEAGDVTGILTKD